MAGGDDTDRLYGLALEEFVAERDALAKRLRADGRRDAAAEVKALPKPTVGAWAANQAVRARVKEARALWAAGDALRDAQGALLAGRGDAAELRRAQEREQAALAPLLEAARGLLTGAGRGLGDDVVERVGATFHAAALDPDQREDAAAGRLTRELTYAGFGLGDDAAPVAARPRSPSRAGTTTRARTRPTRRRGEETDPGAAREAAARQQADREAADRAEAARRERARHEAEQRRERVTAARRAVREAEAAHARAEVELAQAERAAARAAQRLDAARDADAAARKEAQAARREKRRRDDALRSARGALADLEP